MEKVKITNDKNIFIKGQKNNIALLGRKGAEMVNNAKLVLPDVATVEDAHIGMFTDDSNTKLINNNDIEIGKNSIGIYAKDIAVNSGKLKVSSGGIGVISSSGTVLLDTNANITLADSIRPVPVTTHSSSSVRPNITLASSTEENPSIALMTTGNNSDVTNKADIDVGKEGYAFVFKNSGTAGNPGIKFKNEGSTIKLKDNATYIYSEDKFGEIKLDQDTRVEANGDKVYAIYSAGNIVNDGTIDMSQGKGNVAIYGYGGATLTNDEHGNIIVSATDRANQLYGIGMAAGEVNPETKEIISTSTIVNKGTIEVDKEGSIGIFAIGRGSKAVNKGTINISENKAIGMYIDDGAVGENHGTIEITDATKTGINAIFAVNNAVIKNYGRIIVDGSSNNGIYQVNSEIKEKGTIVVNSVESDDTSVNSYQIATVTASKPEKSLGDVAMKKNPKTGNIEVIIDGKEVNPVRIDTINPVDNSHKIEEITINNDIMNISNFHMQDHITDSMINNLGMYVDTSGINFTKPIEGLDTIGNIDALDLILGIEATEYTNAKTIEVGENIMDPYNEVVKKLKSNNAEIRFDIHAGSLTWLGTIKETASKSAFEYAVLQKIPYTIAAEDKDGNIINQDLYNELDGIEQRYGIEPLGSRERLVFTKLNGIGKGEPELFEQAVNEMKGNQYSNTLRRVRTSHDTFAREFDNLMHWRTETKDTMKVKVFGETSKYRSGKLDVNDYTRDAQGVIILNNNETVRLGQSSGFFGGVANEQFKFKDIGGSKEKAITGEIGYYKSNAYGYNNEVNWTWKAGIEGSYRRMDRKYLVVDDIFHAKSKYNTYGVFIDNRVGRNYRVTENLIVEPYAGLDLAVGKVGKIHENKGEIRLDVKSKDYYSVVPNAGVKTKYNIPAGKNIIVTSVDVNVSKEVGNIYDNTMKAKVNRTSAGYYSLVNDKKDNATIGVVGRIGVENESYGVALKAGYSSANKAINGGLEFRVKF
ncbi:hypothetical protein IX317_002102 [Fusobacterium sp. DD29]|uniref:autotransporter outer membrane beta-barrel domain-containing protein n=1 Tax=unclassified Fusobacterium TaxID=2648384 RepID=UPI001B8B0E00|nr:MULTISPECIES: autotransporter outer membrane beta-barrel domain-containing protein [unclassified Fusobacterium]MBR8700517.1 hypothetical protein [Fusobacterium sp. DD45]MBR8710218.1 hypothetical protein [Fusobacterium sp. DD28]MBR8750380.1 hypothetical protein [Fusobacterium sp. DD29]MBR8750740.1 hypothetical protein [Fusobacterium sp. DD26]MBR8762621.1 hypothetical protein [Fusobacterium sp. DD25]